MVTTKRGSKKTPTVKKRTTRAEPMRVIIEIVIRNESSAASGSFKSTGKVFSLTEDDCPENKFTYSFELQHATILSLMVGGYKKDKPNVSGVFTTCILEPNEPAKISVTVLGTVDKPGGRAAMTLSLNGKEVFAAKELDNQGNGMIGFSEFIKLPS